MAAMGEKDVSMLEWRWATSSKLVRRVEALKKGSEWDGHFAPKCGLVVGGRLGVGECSSRLAAAFFDQLPEIMILGQLLVLGQGETGAEKEVADSVLAQDPANDQSLLVRLKVDAVVTCSVAVKNVSVAGHLAKSLGIKVF